MQPEYVLCTIDPQGRRIETQIGWKRDIERRANTLTVFAAKIGAKIRWEIYPVANVNLQQNSADL